VKGGSKLLSQRLQDLLSAAADALADGQIPLSPAWTRDHQVTFEESTIVATHLVALIRAYVAMPAYQQAATFIAGASTSPIAISSLTANAVYHDLMRAAAGPVQEGAV